MSSSPVHGDDFIIDIGGDGDDSTPSSEGVSFHNPPDHIPVPEPSTSSEVVVVNEGDESDPIPPSASVSISCWNIVKRGARHRITPWEGVELPPVKPCLWIIDPPSDEPFSTTDGNSSSRKEQPTSAIMGERRMPSAPIPRRKYCASAETVHPGGRMRTLIEEDIPMVSLRELIPEESSNITTEGISPLDAGEAIVPGGEIETSDSIGPSQPTVNSVGTQTPTSISTRISDTSIGGGDIPPHNINNVTPEIESNAGGESEGDGNSSEIGREAVQGREIAINDQVQESLDENLTHWQRFKEWQPSDENFLFRWMRESKLPGVKEIVKRKVNKCYRFTWLSIVGICTLIGGILTNLAVHKYMGHPLVVTVKAKEVNVYDIALPTAHVLPSDSFKARVLEDAFKMYQDSQDEKYVLKTGWTEEYAARLMYFIDHICNTVSGMARFFKKEVHHNTNIKDRVKTENVPMYDDPKAKSNKKQIMPYLKKGMVNCNEMVSHCVLGGSVMSCRKIIVSTMTNMGIACSFNRMPDKARRKDETMLTALGTDHESTAVAIWKEYDFFKLNHGEQIKTLIEKYRGKDFVNINNRFMSSAIPMTQKSPGMETGLSMVLRYKPDEMTCPLTDSQGFLVQIVAPNVQPDLRNFGIAIPLYHEARLAIYPEIITADESVREIDKHDRGCYFSDEMELDFFHTYTQANCFDECHTKKIIKKCNCTMIYSPQSPGTQLCTPDEAECVKSETARIYQEGIESVCSQCIQDCEQIKYRVELSITPLRKDRLQLTVDEDGNEIKKDEAFSYLNIFWGASNALVYKLSRKIDFPELLAIIGGTIGLTNGYTVLDLFKVPLGFIIAAFGFGAIYQQKCRNDENKAERKERTASNWKRLMRKIGDQNMETTRKWTLMIEAMNELQSQVEIMEQQCNGNPSIEFPEQRTTAFGGQVSRRRATYSVPVNEQ